MSAIPAEPHQTCTFCGTFVVVEPTTRGFPPNVARRKLRKLCQAMGHESRPQYTAAVQHREPATGQ